MFLRVPLPMAPTLGKSHVVEFPNSRCSTTPHASCDYSSSRRHQESSTDRAHWGLLGPDRAFWGLVGLTGAGIDSTDIRLLKLGCGTMSFAAVRSLGGLRSKEAQEKNPERVDSL